MEGHLVVISCPTGSLSATADPEEAKSIIKNYWRVSQEVDWEDTMRPLVYRMIIAPYPLCLSVASVFFPIAQDICIDSSLVSAYTSPEPNPDQWLQTCWQKKKQIPGSYGAAMPPNVYAFIVLPDSLIEGLGQREPRIYSFAPLTWPALSPPVYKAPYTVPSHTMKVRLPDTDPDLASSSPSHPPQHQVPNPVSVQAHSSGLLATANPSSPVKSQPSKSSRYLDEDDLSARVLLLVMKDLDGIIAAKRKELESIEPAGLESVSQSVKALTAQFTDKKMPALQFPEFKMEENKEVVAALSECVKTSKKLKEEVAKLLDRSKQW